MGPSSSLTAGALVGFIFLTYRFLEPIAEFTEVLDQTQNAVAGLRRVLSVLDLPIGPPPPTDPIALPVGKLRIDIREVTFSYPTRRDGADGSRRFGGAQAHRRDDSRRPTGGDRRLDRFGQDDPRSADRQVRRPDDRRHRARRCSTASGRSGRAAPTLDRRVAGAVPVRRLDQRQRRASPSEHSTTHDVERVVDELGVRDWVDSLSDGLATKVGERGDQLSAGERQLVALLRAGLAGPDVLILDEATSSVDALTEVRVASALERLAASRTTIAIAHRLSTAARADRVLVLEHGRLVEDGPHDELIASDGPYRRLYDAWVSSTSV